MSKEHIVYCKNCGKKYYGLDYPDVYCKECGSKKLFFAWEVIEKDYSCVKINRPIADFA